MIRLYGIREIVKTRAQLALEQFKRAELVSPVPSRAMMAARLIADQTQERR
jgi:hypothetical protein